MERDKFNSGDKPFYTSLRVLNPEDIVQLQKKLLEHFSYTIIPQEDLHLTIFHFGKPKSLYQEVAEFVSNLAFDDFLNHFIEFQSNLEIPHTKIELFSTKLDIFGKADSPILVIRLEKNKQLTALRRVILNQFEDFTQKIGVKNLRYFMQQSENLKYQFEETYYPHISIGIVSDTSKVAKTITFDSKFKLLLTNNQ